MSYASNHSTACPPRRAAGDLSELSRPASVEHLSDRQAVIAVMVASSSALEYPSSTRSASQ